MTPQTFHVIADDRLAVIAQSFVVALETRGATFELDSDLDAFVLDLDPVDDLDDDEVAAIGRTTFAIYGHIRAHLIWRLRKH